MSYTKKLNDFVAEMITKLSNKAEASTTSSKHISDNVLHVPDELDFTLDNGRYLTEIKENGIIDNEGYSYNFEVLSTEQLAELVDKLC